MPISEKDVLTVIGTEDLSKYEKVEDFKADFEKKFVAKDRMHEDAELMSSISGRVIGPYETSIKKHFKDAGVEFETGEIKDMKLPEITKLAISKLTTPLRDELETLRAAGGGDEALKKELEKIKDKSNKYQADLTQYKELNTSLTGEIEALKTNFEGEKKNWAINHMKKELYSQIKYKTAGLPESAVSLIKNGFENAIESNYKFDIDESQKLVILTSDGKRVEDPKTSGKVLEPLDAIKNLAVKQNIWEDNPNAGKAQQRYVSATGANGSDSRPTRTVARPMGG